MAAALAARSPSAEPARIAAPPVAQEPQGEPARGAVFVPRPAEAQSKLAWDPDAVLDPLGGKTLP